MHYILHVFEHYNYMALYVGFMYMLCTLYVCTCTCTCTCICLGTAESEGRRRPSEWVLSLVLAPGDRIPTLSVLEEEVGGSLEVEI